jgi:hypothetical protein
MERNTALRESKFSFFLDIFLCTHATSSCWCPVFLCRWDMYEFMAFYFSIKPARWVTFRGRFGGIGVGLLFETCDSPDDEDVDTSSVVLEFH